MSADYPSHWWTPVDRETVAEWEIPPQDAAPGEVILSKRHELGILSNFARAPFEFRGKRYQSVEGIWQMMFYPEGPEDPRAHLTWPHTREEVSQMVAFEAELAGQTGFRNMQALGIDWVSFEGRRMKYWTPEKGEHYRLIVEIMRAKLEQNPAVRTALLSTQGLRLKPDHHQPADAPPSWKYYAIWEMLREELG